MIEAIAVLFVLVLVLRLVLLKWKGPEWFHDPRHGPPYSDWHRPQYPETLAGNKNSGYEEYMKSFDRW